MAAISYSLKTEKPRRGQIIDWLPAVVLPLTALAASHWVPDWALMWLLAYFHFFWLKWLTWRRWRAQIPHSSGRSFIGRSAAYLLAWPGMDARSFLSDAAHVAQ